MATWLCQASAAVTMGFSPILVLAAPTSTEPHPASIREGRVRSIGPGPLLARLTQIAAVVQAGPLLEHVVAVVPAGPDALGAVQPGEGRAEHGPLV
jgi:hypothetical protein